MQYHIKVTKNLEKGSEVLISRIPLDLESAKVLQHELQKELQDNLLQIELITEYEFNELIAKTKIIELLENLGVLN
jgi:hypothetical protein